MLTCSSPLSYSAKPGFFHEENRATLFEVVPETGMLLNTDNGSPMPQVSTIAHHFIHLFRSCINIFFYCKVGNTSARLFTEAKNYACPVFQV